MRAVSTAALLASAAAAPLPGERDLSNYAFNDYVKEFGKTYDANGLDRKKVFDANLKTILAHNSNPSKTWFMIVNDFTDMTPQEFKASHLGGLPDLDDSFFVGEFSAESIEGLPDSVDWRTKAGVVTPVKNQGSCGSCWAFSTTEVLESFYALATGDPAPHFSAQQITSCTPNPKRCGGSGGCQGNIQTQAFNYTAKAGITTENSYPYTMQSGTCDQSKIKPCAQNDGYVKLKVNDYASLMSAVATKGPISISLAAQSFQMYGGGILSNCDCDMDHAVVLLGYGSDGGSDYWLVRNSWGGSWGEKGYIRIKRYGDGKEPTCVDSTPQDGEACAGDTAPRTYAGLCGLMGSSSYPTGMKKTGDCPKPPPGCPFVDCGGCSSFCSGHGGMNCNSGTAGLKCNCADGKSCTGEGQIVV